MNRTVHFLTMILLCSILAACSVYPVDVDYAKNNLYSGHLAGNQPFVDVGFVTSKENGFVWEDCDKLTQQVVEDLQQQAKAAGANRILNVRWRNAANGSYSKVPVCTSRWGWFTALIVGGLMPGVKTVQAKAELSYVTNDKLEALKQAVASGQTAYDKKQMDKAAAEIAKKQQAKAAKKAAKLAKKKAKAEAKAKAKAEKQAAKKAKAEAKAKPSVVKEPQSMHFSQSPST